MSDKACFLADLLGGGAPCTAAALSPTTATQTTCNFCGCRCLTPYRSRDFNTNAKHYLPYHMTLAMDLQEIFIIFPSELPSCDDIESYVL